ncbi:DDB1- and CUL4-associated factor 1-like [Patiria miniata]|uniref:DDB1- and CUL4-associated factor 1 n=1 Tax=Patiria miniata TaxID=46514 RepID=A0A914AZX7_PATMI|nr:DDB1- and CUL4-associated factor 1-like [Patiria miniata]
MKEESAEDSRKEFATLLERWGKERGSTASLAILTRMCEIVEKETDNYIKLDQDPFDDRHPARVDPDCNLGHLMTVLFNKDDFMNQLVTDHIMLSRDFNTNTVACRLLLDVLPGLETSIIFEDTDGLVEKFVNWARDAEEPLRSYATGLLATAIEVQEVAANLREENASLVSVMMSRLHQLMKQSLEDDTSSGCSSSSKDDRPFGCFGQSKENSPDTQRDEVPPEKRLKLDEEITASPERDGTDYPAGLPKDRNGLTEPTITAASENDQPVLVVAENVSQDLKPEGEMDASTSTASAISKDAQTSGNLTSNRIRRGSGKGGESNPQARDATRNTPAAKTKKSAAAKSAKRTKKGKTPQLEKRSSYPEESNSSWCELSYYIIGTHQMYPLTSVMQQRFILQYLTPLAEYQELLGTMFENGAMDIVMHYIDLQKSGDTRLTFDGLKYLSSLICHKKFAVEFVERGGVQQLLQVHRPSIAATGVSMCLYYLAYNADTMERICLLPNQVISNLIGYALWLLECSHESGRSHATMFFTMAFSFWTVLEHFDQQDGIRKLFNTMSTLNILNLEDQGMLLSDDDIFASRQTVKHTCLTLKKYFETHLAVRVDSIKRAYSKNQGLMPPDGTPPFKAITVTAESTSEHMETMLEEAPPNMHWKPVKVFLKIDGVKLLLQIIAMANEWKNYSGRADAIRAALDVLAVITVTTKGQLQLCDQVDLPDNVSSVGMSVINGMAEGEILQDAAVQKAALQVIINSVCGPCSKLGVTVSRFAEGSARRNRTALRTSSDVTEKMWDCVRSNNGIRTLLSLLTIKTPITEADYIRALSCKALCGLSKSEVVRQIVSKLPLFSSGQLQVLVKEPVLQDKQSEHLKFCRYASELIERVTGKPMSLGSDATLSKLHKANIVAQTKITYSHKELLQLIHSHLVSQGLGDTANALIREANLPKSTSASAMTSGLSYTSSTLLTPASVMPRSFHSPRAPPPIPHISQQSTHHPQPNPPPPPSQPQPQWSAQTLPPLSVSVPQDHPHAAPQQGGADPSPSTHSAPSTPQQIGRISFGPDRSAATPGSVNRVRKRLIREKVSQNALYHTGGVGGQLRRRPVSNPPSLDVIVSQYLREQHAHCRNPVVACPSFSLLEPHQCPEPRFRQNAPINATSRIFRRAIRPMHGGVDGARCTRHFIYSRFRPVQTIHEDPEDDACFTCCRFSRHTDPTEMFLWLGTYEGELKAYNIYSGNEEASYSCHDSPISHLEPSKDGKLILTASSWSNPMSALWGIGDTFDKKYTFQNDHHVEFGKLSQDRIIGTKEESAYIYDTSTGQQILKLEDADLSNHYTRNSATFDPTDDLVLNDGVLWDVRSAKPIYKFDQFQSNISGMFHPSGLEIIINSEIWDVRTFHLMHTVPALDQCNIVFNTAGTVIYGTVYQPDNEDDLLDERLKKSPFGSTFRTFDATDYKPIATIDVKRNIFDLATDPTDCYLAVLETQGSVESLNVESDCRLYEVGRPRKADGEEEEDEGDDDDEEDEDGSDDDDDDDDEFDIEDILGGSSDREDGGGEGGEDEGGARDGDGDGDDDDHNSSQGSLASDVISLSSDSVSDDDVDDDEFEDVLFSLNRHW